MLGFGCPATLCKEKKHFGNLFETTSTTIWVNVLIRISMDFLLNGTMRPNITEYNCVYKELKNSHPNTSNNIKIFDVSLRQYQESQLNHKHFSYIDVWYFGYTILKSTHFIQYPEKDLNLQHLVEGIYPSAVDTIGPRALWYIIT